MRTLSHRLGYWLLSRPRATKQQRNEAQKLTFGPRCVCGKKKMPGAPFCGECWAKLPNRVRSGMGQRLKRSFILLHEEAREFLARVGA